MLTARVHWKGGEVTKLDVLKGKSGIHRYVSPPELVELIRTPATEFSDIQIARILHRKRLKTPMTGGFSWLIMQPTCEINITFLRVHGCHYEGKTSMRLPYAPKTILVFWKLFCNTLKQK